VGQNDVTVIYGHDTISMLCMGQHGAGREWEIGCIYYRRLSGVVKLSVRVVKSNINALTWSLTY